MKKYPIFLFVLTLLGGCASEPLMTDAPQTAEAVSVPEGTRSLSDALQIAEDFFSQTKSKTRALPRVVETVEAVSATETRSDDQAPALYLINYADDAGFALIGASQAAYDIYAIADEGHLAMSDTIGNEPLRDFLSKALYHAEAMAYAETENPETRGQIIITDLQYQILEQVEPMLEKSVTKWHQGAPFNKYCFDKVESHTYPVGCGAISLGQLMSFYEQDGFSPFVYDSSKTGKVSMAWDSFSNIDFDDLSDSFYASLMEDLSKSLSIVGTLLGCRYTDKDPSSYSNSRDFRHVLSQIGYVDQREAFLDTSLKDSLNVVMSFMKKGLNDFHAAPVIFAGVGDRTNTNSGHFWVADGYVKRQCRNTKPFPLYVTGPILFHCVWGQASNSGFNNGYYAFLTEADMIDAQEYIPTGGKRTTLLHPYYDILAIGGYKRYNPYVK